MLVRDIKRLALLVVPLFGLLLISYSLWDPETNAQLRSHVGSLLGKGPKSDKEQAPLQAPGSRPPPIPDRPHSPPPLSPPSNPNPHPGGVTNANGGTTAIDLPASDGTNGTHHEIFSLTTADGGYFSIVFGNESTFNPNIIPHPTNDGVFIIVAQKSTTDDDPDGTFFEVACDATFVSGVLRCQWDAPDRLPVAAIKGDDSKCVGHPFDVLALNKGPHDARLFFGPKQPYLTFGSNSMLTCFGQWIQDFRTLVKWDVETVEAGDFTNATELQRPPPISPVEKNWFLFWDKDGEVYTHYEVAPARSFAKLRPNGSVGPNLAPFAAEQDEKCLGAYLPKLPEENEDIHQATNSLRITMCNRADPGCTADATNTFIMTIFQHKKWYDFHGEYEPYVMLFRERSPFEVYAVSRKPIWIHGRKRLEKKKTEMVYVAAMNWMDKGLKYHGFLDDQLLLSFGIEDKFSGGMDIRASDLLSGLGLCSDV